MSKLFIKSFCISSKRKIFFAEKNSPRLLISSKFNRFDKNDHFSTIKNTYSTCSTATHSKQKVNHKILTKETQQRKKIYTIFLNKNILHLKLILNEFEKLKIEQIAIPVPWGNIRGQIFGNPSANNAKPILCLHGFLDNSNSFKPLAEYLTQTNQYYLIALDYPGHGHSSKIPNGIPYTQKLIMASVRRAVRHLKLNKFYFCCHSFGIYISLFVKKKNRVMLSSRTIVRIK